MTYLLPTPRAPMGAGGWNRGSSDTGDEEVAAIGVPLALLKRLLLSG